MSATILDVKADDKCGNCFNDFADHNYDAGRDLYVCPYPHQETGYGGFKGGDPNNFHPDSECSSPQEIAAWRKACKEWDGTPLELQRCRGADGISGSGWRFGIGVYTIESEQTWAAR